ncbi:hypothetical protein [Xenorhabdus entomophaga]|uniref:hypothetical protein n=1 Tax=Xenorhabdus entomophaga TaxID=3136257 RepID=UPI0030F45965
MMSLPWNLFLARRAINFVNITLGITSPNQLPAETQEQQNQKSEYNNQVSLMRNRVENIVDRAWKRRNSREERNDLYRKVIMGTSAYVIENRIGNCAEKSCVAFTRLKRMGAKPLELFEININNQDDDYHSIVVIGRTTGNSQQPRTWNHEAVICDAWSKQAYPSTLYENNIAFAGQLTLLHRYD